MSYKALYLTYRPQTFLEVAGQKPIVRTLTNALKSGKIAHAYLFAGPRGTGKTSLARLFAKALNCEKGVGNQCNECSNCLEITEGTHPDVVEIDAASNNGVDQIRDLIEKVKYAPIKGRYKVYIIDEVHMMSTGAFNALLKTLEEPPENVIFILCTTEPYKVIPTILSRCQRFDFSKLSDDEMKGKLLEVLQKEKTVYDDEGVNAIISLADGGMRDAFTILDQVLAYSGNVLRAADVLTIYGLASIDEKIDLLRAIRNGDVARIIGKSEAYVSSGIDIRRLVSDLINILKNTLIYEKTNDISLIVGLTKEQADTLASLFDSDMLNSMIDTFLQTQNDFKNVSDVRSLFELALLKLASTIGSTELNEVKPAKPAPIVKKVGITSQKAVEKPAETPKTEETPQISPKVIEKSVEVPSKETNKEETPAAKEEPDNQPPDFLFEDEKPAPAPKAQEPAPAPAPEETPEEEEPSLDTSKVYQPAIQLSGEKYEMSDDEIIKVMVLANKEERTALVKKWPQLNKLRVDPKLGNLAALLSDGHPYCLCQEVLILSYDFKRLKDKANIRENQFPLASLVQVLLGRKVFVFAIDPSDRNRVISEFFNLQTIKKLPLKNEVKLNLPK